MGDTAFLKVNVRVALANEYLEKEADLPEERIGYIPPSIEAKLRAAKEEHAAEKGRK